MMGTRSITSSDEWRTLAAHVDAVPRDLPHLFEHEPGRVEAFTGSTCLSIGVDSPVRVDSYPE